MPWALTTALALLAVALGFIAYRHATEDAPRVLKVSVLPPEKAIARALSSPPAVSPDGRSIAFTASVDGKNQIWVRDLDSLAARPLAGTEDGDFPFWSPDSRWIAFGATGKLKKVDVGGGPALPLCDAPFVVGSWSKDYIIIGGSTGILRVAPGGGDPTLITTLVPNQELVYVSPWFLPDGRHFLFGVLGADLTQNAIYAGDVESKDPAKNRHKVLAGTTSSAYALVSRNR